MAQKRRANATKRKAKPKPGRPRDVTPEVVEQARVLMGAPRHLSVVDAAAELGVGKTQLYARLAEAVSAAETDDGADEDLELAEGGTDEDTLVLARRLLGKVLAKLERADPVRFSSLAEKANGLLGRIEQIQAKRPRVPTPDAVQEAIRAAMDESTDHLLRHTAPAAERWAKFLPRLRVALALAAPDLLRELDMLTGGAAA